jgi:hypothetical protein
MTLRPIAIHLPQFHPVPENDTWWGKGFTEWRNVVQARPRFRGHYQPHLPADMGFYDMRLPEVRQKQAHLAQEYGIYGFCYYHYWFNGRRILERPVQEILESSEPDFPFMLCWANENWTRVWDGSDKTVLLAQEYSEDDDRAHAEALMPYFKDPRYIRINDKPVFAIYKDGGIPNPERLCDVFREVAAEHGMSLYLCRFERRMGTRTEAPQELGFDAGIEFQPLSPSFNRFEQSRRQGLMTSARHIATRLVGKVMKIPGLSKIVRADGYLPGHKDYKRFVEFDIKQPAAQHLCYPGVSPSWDNTSRRSDGHATIFWGSTPAFFKKWVRAKVGNFKPPSEEEDFLFINAWNEWAEGNHLEPCLKYGHQYLKALQNGVEGGLKDRGSDV